MASNHHRRRRFRYRHTYGNRCDLQLPTCSHLLSENYSQEAAASLTENLHHRGRRQGGTRSLHRGKSLTQPKAAIVTRIQNRWIFQSQWVPITYHLTSVNVQDRRSGTRQAYNPPGRQAPAKAGHQQTRALQAERGRDPPDPAVAQRRCRPKCGAVPGCSVRGPIRRRGGLAGVVTAKLGDEIGATSF